MPARPQPEGPLLTQQFTITVSRPDGTSIPVVVTKKRVKKMCIRDSYRDVTLVSLRIMDAVRQQAGITFPADAGKQA